MTNLIRSRITQIWLLLVAATAISWEMGHGVGFNSVRYASVSIIVIAFVKVRFVIMDFMEIRGAPLFMRIVAEAWALTVCSALVVLYLRSAA